MNAFADHGFEIEPESPQAAEARKVVGQAKAESTKKERPSNAAPFDDVEPWPEPIVPDELLKEIAAVARRFIACSLETAHAAALWAAMTWFMDVVEVAPLVVITAPEKRCGKSQLLTVLSRISCRPLTASNITPAALFRCIDAWSPTLFIDEADAFMRENEELRGLINCGHSRDSAYIVRTVGTEFIPKKFSVWGAKAMSGIGHLADTIMDRAIVLELRRKLPTESVERLRHAEAGLWHDLTRKLARFAQDYSRLVQSARPDLPRELNDRAQDNWEPLLQIADTAGGDWPRIARIAASKLSGEDEQTMTIGVELLSDIQEIFDAKKVDRLFSVDLVAALTEDDEKPWAGYNRGFPIKPAQVAKRLREYGICSKTIRIYGDTKKGYMRSQFEDAFSRYLCPDALKAGLTVTPSPANRYADSAVTSALPVTVVSGTGYAEGTDKATIGAGCDGVTVNSGNMPESQIEVEL
jgi:putative DNA primase/helicase